MRRPSGRRFAWCCRSVVEPRPSDRHDQLTRRYRTIGTHLIRKAGHTKTEANTGAVTLIQRFGSVLNLNILFQLLFVEDIYIGGVNEIPAQFHWVKAPTRNDRLQDEPAVH